MSVRKPPLLLRGGLTGRVYIVTAYDDHGDGRYTARTKFDVTEQYNALRAEDEAPAPRPLCQYCGADCSQGRSWDGDDHYACPSCADRRAAESNARRAAAAEAIGAYEAEHGVITQAEIAALSNDTGG